MVDLTITICTFNRANYLKKCLDSLFSQIQTNIEILIIDNNSSDNTAFVSKYYSTNYKNIKYVLEKKIGVSYARNRGIKEAKADWILFIDDDAIAFPDMVERALYLVNRGDFDCVGGMYFGYYEGDKPKWISQNYGTKEKYSESLNQCPYYVPHGGIVLYKKSMLSYLNGFSINYGIQGEIKGLGEETELQFRASKLNYKIGFDPELKVFHLVKSEYTTLYWFINRAYLTGKTSTSISKENNIWIAIFKFIKSIFGMFFVRLPFNLFQLLFNNNYFWQNFIYDTFMPNVLFFGQINGSLIQLK